jgi:hypothetical protein
MSLSTIGFMRRWQIYLSISLSSRSTQRTNLVTFLPRACLLHLLFITTFIDGLVTLHKPQEGVLRVSTEKDVPADFAFLVSFQILSWTFCLSIIFHIKFSVLHLASALHHSFPRNPEFVLTSEFFCCHLLHHSTRLIWVALHAFIDCYIDFYSRNIIIISVYIKRLIRLLVSTFTSHLLFHQGTFISPGLGQIQLSQKTKKNHLLCMHMHFLA